MGWAAMGYNTLGPLHSIKRTSAVNCCFLTFEVFSAVFSTNLIKTSKLSWYNNTLLTRPRYDIYYNISKKKRKSAVGVH